MILNGKINIRAEIPREIKLGTIAYFGVPYGKKFDHVRLPKL
jgi:hypothetical protein